MHSTLVRLQNVFGFFTTVAFTVAAVIALSSFISPQSPSAKIEVRNVQVVRGRPHYYSYKKEEYAHVRFDLDADLHTLFNWNTKQIFLYLKATYPSLSPDEPPSEAIIWDAILASTSAPWHQNHYIHPTAPNANKKKSVLPKISKKAAAAGKKPKSTPETAKKDIGTLHLANQRPKYQITDLTGRLQNRTDVVLELGWNVQPWVGALTWTNWQTLGAWKGLEGGRSEAFGFPEIGGKVKSKKDLETERGGEGYRLEVGGEQPRRKAT
ncbi:signal peptidase 22 kDa subunit [Dothidotthia symphoricarpi CBS 119687]|uniref:Signal peptidase subunit 3 n=1 Tax=Dothidotthia symphoricarpi CBS 119687 TaxID=1392245 RepID=A0A6A6A2E5_9PLEO|nr:signal peptidase 22 kDa subunit [Dothidotthia symphoricarpi CBS 119687]KAF2125353.1 signal peptidase 22 kDa subunit [Dothidotthia symphoricarpi CBS 119687]